MHHHSKTFLFYDIETTGLNPCFDQIIQFAAIRTDLKLNELERYEFIIQLNPDQVMSAYSLITHRLDITQLMAGEKEYFAIQKIHRLFNTPGTISIGYNNLGFDDEFLRFAFFRNWFPVYTHQFANQCSRMDLYPITILYFLHKKEALEWPIINDHISLKLEHLAAANNIHYGQAHHALVDVLTTIEIAKRFYQFSDVWEYCLGYFDKTTDLQRQNKLSSQVLIDGQTYKTALLIKGKIGAKWHYQAPVIQLGQHRHYKNQTIWLRLDNENLNQISMDSIAATAPMTIRKRAAEQEFLLPLTPSYSQYLCDTRKKLLQNNQCWLQENSKLLQAICDYHLSYQYPTLPHIDIDAALYTLGFPSPQLERVFAQFHQLSYFDKFNLVESLSDLNRKNQGFRLLARNFLNEFPAEKHSFLQQSLQTHDEATDFRGKTKLSAQVGLQQIDELCQQSSLNDQQRALLIEYRQHLCNATIPA